jgi:hypothetical protein
MLRSSSKRGWETSDNVVPHMSSIDGARGISNEPMTKRGRVWLELPIGKQETLSKMLKRGRMETSIGKKKAKTSIKESQKRKTSSTNDDNTSGLSEMFKQVCVKPKKCNEQEAKKEEQTNKNQEKEVEECAEEFKDPKEQEKLFLQALTTLLTTAPYAEQYLSNQWNAKFDEMAQLESMWRLGMENSEIMLQKLVDKHVIDLTRSADYLKKMILMFERLMYMTNHSLDALLPIQAEIFNK